MPEVKPTHIDPNAHQPGYKRTKLGRIPEEWEIAKLSDFISSLHAGVSVNGEERPLKKGEIGVLKVSAVSYGEFDPNQIKAVNKSEEGRVRQSPQKGLLLISRANSPELVGATVLLTKDYPRLFLSDKVWQANFFNLKSSAFVHYYLRLDRSRFRISNLATGTSSSMKNISKSSFLGLKIPLPPLPEQQKIAQILTTWDRAIRQTQDLIKQLRQRNRGLAQQLLTGQVRVKGFEGEWDWPRADAIFANVSIKKHPNEELLAVTQEKGIIPRDMLEGRVTMPSGDRSGFKLVQPGNFVISLRSFQGGLEYSEYRGLVSPAYTVLKSILSISDKYYQHYFKSHHFIGHLATSVIGIRDGKQISFKDFQSQKLPSPPLPEQKAISNILEAADAEVRVQEARLSKLQEQKRGLMQALLTGAVRVKNMNPQ